jgi:hypothetical protein
MGSTAVLMNKRKWETELWQPQASGSNKEEFLLCVWPVLIDRWRAALAVANTREGLAAG